MSEPAPTPSGSMRPNASSISLLPARVRSKKRWDHRFYFVLIKVGQVLHFQRESLDRGHILKEAFVRAVAQGDDLIAHLPIRMLGREVLCLDVERINLPQLGLDACRINTIDVDLARGNIAGGI